MQGGSYTVKYGTGGKHRYTHSHHASGYTTIPGRKTEEQALAEAKSERDAWLAGGGWGGDGPLWVWVEDKVGNVVYGVQSPRAAAA